MSQDGSFYTVATKNIVEKLNDNSPTRLYTQIVFLNEEGVQYVREVYDILGVLGDLGGIFEITMIVFGFFLFPISEHNFFMKAAQDLYFARTKEKNIFAKKEDSDEEGKLEKWQNFAKFEKVSCSSLNQEIRKHHIIRLSLIDDIKLFMANILKSLCCDCCWDKKKKLQKLYELSEERISN